MLFRSLNKLLSLFFSCTLLFQTKGNLKNPLKKVYSGKVAMLANGPSMKNVLPRLTTDEFKNTDFIVLNFFGMFGLFPIFVSENKNIRSTFKKGGRKQT